MMMRQDLAMLFVVSAGPKFGLGHLRRMQTVARAAFENASMSTIHFFVVGCAPSDVAMLDHDPRLGSIKAGSLRDLSLQNQSQPDVVLFDLHRLHVDEALSDLADDFSHAGTMIVAIDHVAVQADIIADLRWVPSFFKDPLWPSQLDVEHGWDHYLFEKKRETLPAPGKNRLLILTGGSDVARLGGIWPSLLEERLDQPLEVTWVQGPFAQAPELPYKTKHNFTVTKAPDGLDDLINACDWVLTVHGVSVFEALSYQRTCIVYNPYQDQNSLEMQAFEAANVAAVAHDHDEIIAHLKVAMANQPVVSNQNMSITSRLDGQGAHRLLQRVRNVRDIKGSRVSY